MRVYIADISANSTLEAHSFARPFVDHQRWGLKPEKKLTADSSTARLIIDVP